MYSIFSFFSSMHINSMPSLFSCTTPVSPIFFTLPSCFHSPTQNWLHSNCRINTAWFKPPYHSNVWTWWKPQRGTAFAFLEDQKWKIITWRHIIFRPLWENVTMNSSCLFMCENLYSCCFININICWKVSCFVFYIHICLGACGRKPVYCSTIGLSNEVVKVLWTIWTLNSLFVWGKKVIIRFSKPL